MSEQENTNKSGASADKKSAKKNKKPKGPIRTGAVTATLVLAVLIGAYFYFAFDSNLKSGLEWTLTYLHRAEVNIGKIKTSLRGGYLHIYDVQVTKKEAPEQNLISVGAIKLQLLWDALLRAKIVVDESAIENIQLYSKRAKPGAILPEKPVEQEDGGANKAYKEVEQAALEQTKKDFDKNVLGDVAAILGGADTKAQLEQIKSDLTSEKKINELKTALKEKEEAWKLRLKQLPDNQYVDQIKVRSQKLKFNINDPKQFANDLKEAQALIKEVDEKIKNIKQTGSDLDGDLNVINQSFKQIDEYVKQDLKDLQGRLKIPNLDVKDFSQKLFLSLLEKKISGFNKYFNLARQYMPPKKSTDEKIAKKESIPRPPKRGKGINIQYPVTVGYPLFWLRHGKISSQSNESEFSGDITGEVIDVTSDPVYLKKPAYIKINGNFPKQGIVGLDATVTMDHTTSSPKDQIYAKIAKYDAGRQVLSSSDDLNFEIENSKGSLVLNGVMQNNQLLVKIDNQFNEVKYLVEAKSKQVKEIITNVVNGIPVITLVAKATGPVNSLNWSIRSNLGSELSSGLKAQIQGKIDEAKKELDNFVNSRIKGEKEKLTAELDKFKNQYKGEVDKAKAKIEGAKQQAEKEAEQKKKAVENQQKKQLEDKGKKLLKDLGKKFKF